MRVCDAHAALRQHLRVAHSSVRGDRRDIHVRCVLLLALVACGADPPVAWTGQRPLSIDIEITTDRVTVHAPTTETRRFAAPGTCIELTDGVAVEDSCLERVTVDGEAVPWGDAPSTSFERASPRELVLEGCAQRSAIPLPPRTDVPTPSLLPPTRDGGAVTLAWTTDRPAASSQVVIGTGYAGQACHVVAATEHTFVVPDGFVVQTSSVVTFVDVVEIPTTLGVVRVWHGAADGYTRP